MPHIYRPLTAPLILLAAAVCLAGCYRYAEVRDVDARAPAGPIDWARVTTRERPEFPMREVTIGADSIVGRDAGVRLALARTDVVRIRERRPDVMQMVLASAGVLGVAGFIVLGRRGGD